MRRIFSMRLLCASAFIVVSGMLTGCVAVRGPVPCEEIGQKALRNLPYDVITNPQTLDWVESTYQLDSTAISDEQVRLRWTTPGNLGHVATFEDGTLGYVYVYWAKGQGPTVQEVLDCLGAPDYYEAAIKPDLQERFDLSLWYPDEGIELSSHSFGRYDLAPPVVTTDRRMDGITVTKPGTLADLVKAAYGYGRDDETPEHLISTLKPWPGGLDQITIDNLLPQ